jgi:hypothetical protein
VAASVVAALIISASVTFAWLTSYQTATNSVALPQYMFHVRIDEDFEKPAPGELKPGVEFDKRVAVVNKGDLSAVVRILLHPNIMGYDQPYVYPANIGQEVIADVDTENWMLGEDNYYYYLKVLKPGEQTPDIITKVSLRNGLPSDYHRAYFHFDLKSEASFASVYDCERSFWDKKPPPPSKPNLVEIYRILSEQMSE